MNSKLLYFDRDTTTAVLFLENQGKLPIVWKTDILEDASAFIANDHGRAEEQVHSLVDAFLCVPTVSFRL
jgi:hypothetical protein